MTVGKAHVYCTRENFEESVTRVFKILQRLSQCKWENMWVSFFSPDGSRESTPIGCSKCWLNITIFSTEPEMWDNIQRVWFYMTKKTKDSSDRVSWPSNHQDDGCDNSEIVWKVIWCKGGRSCFSFRDLVFMLARCYRDTFSRYHYCY